MFIRKLFTAIVLLALSTANVHARMIKVSTIPDYSQTQLSIAELPNIGSVKVTGRISHFTQYNQFILEDETGTHTIEYTGDEPIPYEKGAYISVEGNIVKVWFTTSLHTNEITLRVPLALAKIQ